MTTSAGQKLKIKSALTRFIETFEPYESAEQLLVLDDHRTDAKFCECHIKASKLVEYSTVDVPLDPDDQSDYRANRELVTDAPAFYRMKEDAIKRRSFSNIVAEYTTEFDEQHPLKIIGGQHRFEAIRLALDDQIDELHGIKVYFALDTDQRLDVQLISNTVIAVARDLFDRMHETVKGPELRNWCQTVGLLKHGEDFTDKRQRGGAISVQLARTFITNYLLGSNIDQKKFEAADTTPVLCPTGTQDSQWDDLRATYPLVWQEEQLIRAGKEFSKLVDAQRKAFDEREIRPPPDFPEKTMNPAILAAWAYVAGMLKGNKVRLERHYNLSTTQNRDPLNVMELSKGRHKSDPDNYRGLGYRSDPKERGRFVELFFLQAEEGKGITKAAVDIAIKQYHAKQAQLEVVRAKDREIKNAGN